jgi:hypothetical protein
LGLPADFLIASDGRVLACKYGAHAYDQWSVDEILAFTESASSANQRLVNQEEPAASLSGNYSEREIFSGGTQFNV